MNYILLSKEMSCALRHEPQAYGLELDEFGAVDVNTFYRRWKNSCALWTLHRWKSGERKSTSSYIFVSRDI